jgi:hypothetical protein
MIEAFIAALAFLGGWAAHQTDALVREFPPRWELLSRYIIGTLVVFGFFVAFLQRLRPRATRDGALSFAMASWFVGLGVAFGHWRSDKKAQGG